MEETINPKQPVRGDDREEFEIEFVSQRGDIPFVEVFEDSSKFKDYLYNDFCNSTPVPCLRLYLRNYFTDEEIKQGYKEANDRIPFSDHHEVVVSASAVLPTKFEDDLFKKTIEFNKLLKDNNIEAEYYLPKILYTNIIATLIEVKKLITEIKREPFFDGVSIPDYCNSRVFLIMDALNKLQLPDLTIAILDSIISDDDNSLNLFFADKEGKHCFDAIKKWEHLKNDLNCLLKKEIELITAPNPVPPKTVDEKTIKPFIEYFPKDKREPLLKKLTTLLNGQTGKAVAIIIMALEDKYHFRIQSKGLTGFIKLIVDEFGYVGSRVGISNFYRKSSKSTKGNIIPLVPYADIQLIIDQLP